MYLEFLYIPLDYLSTLTKAERWFDFIIPSILGVGSIYFDCQSPGIQLTYIKDFIPFDEILLGFVLAAFALIASSEKFKTIANSYPSQRKIRGVSVSLYRVLVANFAYLILAATLVVLLYFISKAIPIEMPFILARIINGVYIAYTFSIILCTIRAIFNLYFTQVSSSV